MLMVITDNFNVFPLEALMTGISMRFNVQSAIKLHVEHGNFSFDDTGNVSLDAPPELKLEIEKNLLVRSYKIESAKKPVDWEMLGQTSHFVVSKSESLVESAIFTDLKSKAQARLLRTMRKYIINKGNIAKLDRFIIQLKDKLEQVSNVPAGFTNTSFSDQLDDLLKQKRKEERRLTQKLDEFDDFAKAKTTETEWQLANEINDPDVTKQFMKECASIHFNDMPLVNFD